VRLSDGPRYDKVHEIEHLDDIEDCVKAAVWYSEQDYVDIKESYKCTIFLYEAGQLVPEEEEEKASDTVREHTLRGLEGRTVEGAWEKFELRRNAINAVLDLQDEQWQQLPEGEPLDDELISRSYFERFSRNCMEHAVARGLRDEKAALRILRSIMPRSKRKNKKELKKQQTC